MLNDVNEDRLNETAAEAEKTGVDCLSIAANTAAISEVEEMFERIVQKFGRLDVLVNNAGITRDGFLHKIKEEQWKQVIDVNLTGIFFVFRPQPGS